MLKPKKNVSEKVSRSIFKFNNELDRMVIGPIAKGYNKLPAPIKNGAEILLAILELY